jgi:Iap family predicted aminopeptidase
VKLLSTVFCLLLVPSPSWGVASGRHDAPLNLSTPEQFKEEFAAVPCKDEDRLAAARALFEKMGAPAGSVSVEKYKGVENLVVRKPGASDETVIVGAHYDKVSAGCGAVDNWSGVVAVAHLYRTLKDTPLKKTILFVAFGKEEQGLVGSRAMAEAIEKEQLPRYCAALNIDSLGLAQPQTLDNASDRKLIALAADTAKELKMPFARAGIEGADSDSSSFRRRKIPAVTIHGLSDRFASVIHGGNDKAAKVNEASVYLGYRLALSMLARISESPCDAYR